MTRECHQRLAEILSGFTVDLAGRKPGTIQQDLRLDHDRDNTTLCGRPLRPLRIVNRIHVERCSGSWHRQQQKGEKRRNTPKHRLRHHSLLTYKVKKPSRVPTANKSAGRSTRRGKTAAQSRPSY